MSLWCRFLTDETGTLAWVRKAGIPLLANLLILGGIVYVARLMTYDVRVSEANRKVIQVNRAHLQRIQADSDDSDRRIAELELAAELRQREIDRLKKQLAGRRGGK